VIYADPPWRYENWSMKERAQRGERWARRHGRSPYDVMDTDELARLPIFQLALPDCALFLWATFPKLPDAFRVIEAWGFTYKTVAFTWVKQNPKGDGYKLGMGFWTRSNAEICLLATRGHPKRQSKRVRQLVIAPAGEHSAKPPEVRERIVTLMGDVPRLEIFARLPVPEGWEATGLDFDGRDVRLLQASCFYKKRGAVEGAPLRRSKSGRLPATLPDSGTRGTGPLTRYVDVLESAQFPLILPMAPPSKNPKTPRPKGRRPRKPELDPSFRLMCPDLPARELEHVLLVNQALPAVEIDGRECPRVRFGEEVHLKTGQAGQAGVDDRCPACSARWGGIHRIYCPVEECLHCGGSLFYEARGHCHETIAFDFNSPLNRTLRSRGLGQERNRTAARSSGGARPSRTPAERPAGKAEPDSMPRVVSVSIS
jgi:N6-adenosine-specific RNA methylase IME4